MTSPAANAASRDAANIWTGVTQVVADLDARQGARHRFDGSVRGAEAIRTSASAVLFESTLVLRERAANGVDHAVRITLPLVRRYPDGWHLASFTLDGAALRYAAVRMA